VADGTADNAAPTLVERWIAEQQQWQRTLLGYLDSMVKSEEFLVHLGNAMRGSLLGGKPYPVAAPVASLSQTRSQPGVVPGCSGDQPRQTPSDDRFDQLLFAVHELQGQVNDLAMTLDELRAGAAAGRRRPATRAPATRRRPVADAPLLKSEPQAEKP
jgi:hypothetical protein